MVLPDQVINITVISDFKYIFKESEHAQSGYVDMTGVVNVSGKLLPSNNSLSSSTCHVEPEGIAIGCALALVIILTIFGNMLVLIATVRIRHMWTVSNGMIASLATADLLVAIAVLPVSLQQEVCNQVWTLGKTMCIFWVSADVFCCTSSILNIVAIALDRYFSIIMNVEYTHRPDALFSRRRVCCVMVTVTWVVSLLIAVSPPLFNWYAGTEFENPHLCIISHDLGYTIFSTFGAFYIPLGIILFVYYKIYRVVLARANRKRQIRPVFNTSSAERSVITETSELNAASVIDRSENGAVSKCKNGLLRPKKRTRDKSSSSASPDHGSGHRERSRRSVKLLGIIIVCFMLCWLPFFIPGALLPFCPACQMPPRLYSFVLWLGYSNSFLNPFIYALWSQDFQIALRKLLPCVADRIPK